MTEYGVFYKSGKYRWSGPWLGFSITHLDIAKEDEKECRKVVKKPTEIRKLVWIPLDKEIVVVRKQNNIWDIL